VNVIWILRFFKQRKEVDYARFYNRGSNQDNINEIILGMQDIRLNNLEHHKINNWYLKQEEQNALAVKMFKIDRRQSIGSLIFGQLENIVISFFTALAVINGKMTLGMMMSINLIVGQLKGTISQFIMFMQSYQEASISLNRLMEIHNNKEEDQEAKLIGFNNNEIGDLTLQNISFRYDIDGEYILKDINFTIPKGLTTAIVGGSGSGKTTLLKLLLKYHSPSEGRILINEENDLSQVESKWWWQQCGAVMQESFIFSDTIENNIACSEQGIEKERIDTAKRIANLAEFIDSMPQKGETRIGATGTGISGGQKQRLLIARAVYKNPQFLLFDEATSSLDSENEEIIMKNINKYFNVKTKIIIAHRYSTIRHADKIIVLDRGKIVQEGTHAQLITVEGKYLQLFAQQLTYNENHIQ
jgi:ATP-binding cassette subfamily B protein